MMIAAGPGALALEGLDEPAELLVHRRDLAEIGLAGMPRGLNGSGRLVGRVRVEVVDPEQERPVAALLEIRAPARSSRARRSAPALNLVVVDGRTRARGRSGARGRRRRRRPPSGSRPAGAVPRARERCGAMKRPFSWTPWPAGYSPVIIEPCDGSVSGAVAYAWRNRRPRAATALKAGRVDPLRLGPDGVVPRGVERDEQDGGPLGRRGRILGRRPPAAERREEEER
jgi:hypothetical protein